MRQSPTLLALVSLALAACGGAVDPGATAPEEPGAAQALAPQRAYSGPVLQGPAVVAHADRWMEELAPVINTRQLDQLVIPGTHDSGTYGVISTWQRPVNDLFAPDADSTIVKLGSFFGVTEAWSRSQRRDLLGQLNDGIRSVDLRPCVDKGGTLRICHGLYGPTWQDLLTQVQTFAAAHPYEIVLLNLGGYSQNAYGDMDAATAARVHAMVKSVLAGHLVDHSQVTPQTRLVDLWTQQPGRSIIVTSLRQDPDFWFADATVTGSWRGNIWDYWQKKSDLDAALASSQGEPRMFSLSAAATPDTNAIGLGLAPFVPGQTHPYPHSLEDLAAGTNPVMLSWMVHDWARLRVNIASVDFYDESCLLPVAWQLNGAGGVSLAGCNITPSTWNGSRWVQGDSAWVSWRGAKACPGGFRDDGAYCYKPAPYGRGAGYPWHFGDPFNASGMFARCERDWGRGNCEEYGLIVYPKCRAGFHNVGANICSPDCPAGMTDIGISCQK